METRLRKITALTTRENRLLFDAAPKAPEVAGQDNRTELEKVTQEGFYNPDGGYYDPTVKSFHDGKGKASTMTPEAALKVKQPGAFPLRTVEKQADVAAAKAGAEVAKTDVKVEAAAAKIELKTALGLSDLQKQMSGKFTDLAEAMKVELRDSQRLKKDFTFDKNFDGAKICETAGDDIKTELGILFVDPGKSAQFKKLVDYVKPYFQKEGQDISEDDVSTLLSNLYSISAKESLQKKMADMRLADFAKTVGDTAYPMHYEIAFDKTDLASTISSTDPKFKETNDKYVKEHPVAATDPKAVERRDADCLDRGKKLRATWFGGLLSMAGIVKLEEAPEGETPDGKKEREARNDLAYADVLKGENAVAKWLIVICGGGAMLDGGGADVDEQLAGMDPRAKGIFDKAKAIAKMSPLSLAGTAEKLKPIAAKEAEKTEEIAALDKGKFGEALKDAAKIPYKFSLKEGWEATEGNKLVVTLKGDAGMVLPKGTSIRANNKPEVADDKADRPFKDTVLNITGPIPAGTTFKGKVQFAQEKLEA